MSELGRTNNLSTEAAALLAWTKRLIAGRASPPSDFQIARRFGLRTPDDAMTLLNELRSAGLIEVERTSNGRVIHVVDELVIPRGEVVTRAAADQVRGTIPYAPTEAVKPKPRPAPFVIGPERPPLVTAAAAAIAPSPPPALPPALPELPTPPEEEPAMPEEVAAAPQPSPVPDLPTPGEVRAEILLEELTRCAREGLPCPSDKQIAKLLGYKGETGVYGPLNKLIGRGAITVERVPGQGRVVTIAATGQSTAPVGKLAHAARMAPPAVLSAPPAPAATIADRPKVQNPFNASVSVVDGAAELTVYLSLDPGPAREFRPFLTVPMDEMHLLELLGTAALAMRDLQRSA